MKAHTKVAIVTVVLGALAFLTEANGPLGTFWAPNPTFPRPEGVQLVLFMILGATEALAFGLGVAFLLFGYEPLKASTQVSPTMTRIAHLSISWVLINWWAHDSLHQHIGMDLSGLLKIEYGFHMTLIAAGVMLTRFFMLAVQPPAKA